MSYQPFLGFPEYWMGAFALVVCSSIGVLLRSFFPGLTWAMPVFGLLGVAIAGYFYYRILSGRSVP